MTRTFAREMQKIATSLAVPVRSVLSRPGVALKPPRSFVIGRKLAVGPKLTPGKPGKLPRMT